MQNKHDENGYDYQGGGNQDYYQPDDYDYNYGTNDYNYGPYEANKDQPVTTNSIQEQPEIKQNQSDPIIKQETIKKKEQNSQQISLDIPKQRKQRIIQDNFYEDIEEFETYTFDAQADTMVAGGGIPKTINPFASGDIILPEFKPKLAIVINRSSFISIQQGLKIQKSFTKMQKKIQTKLENDFEMKHISLHILDCSISVYSKKTSEQEQNINKNNSLQKDQIDEHIFDSRLNFQQTHIADSKLFDIEQLTNLKLKQLQENHEIQVQQNRINDKVKDFLSQKMGGQANREQNDEAAVQVLKNFHNDSDVNDQQLANLHPYKYLPLPELNYFIQQMKNYNVKSYDDILLYCQSPKDAGEADLKSDPLDFIHLMGIFRAQYLFETFNHKGNIYILLDYTPEKWKEHGGSVFEKLIPDQFMPDDHRPERYAYKLQPAVVKQYIDIKNYQSYIDFKEQQAKRATATNKQLGFDVGSAPVVVETRPWVERKARGSIPKVYVNLNFMDLFNYDPLSGAKVLKHHKSLKQIFEAQIPGLLFDYYEAQARLMDQQQANSNSNLPRAKISTVQVPMKEVTFTDSCGLSACQGYVAMLFSLKSFSQEISAQDLQPKKLSRNFTISVYDGSYEGYLASKAEEEQLARQKQQQGKDCSIF